MARSLKQKALGFGKLLRAIVFALFAFLMAENIHAEDLGTNTDFQSWNTVRLTHKVNEKWFVALQNEARFNDHISNLDEYIVKFYGHYKFSDRTGLSFGYKYIDRPDGPNETDPWVELALHSQHGVSHYPAHPL